MQTYLAYFSSNNWAFRIPELISIAKIFNIPFEYDHTTDIEETPLIYIQTNDENSLKLLSSRSVGLKGFYEVWGHAENHEALKESISNFASANKEKYDHFVNNSCFKFNIESYGRHYTNQEREDLMGKFRWMNWKSRVDLKNPEAVFSIIEDYGRLAKPTDPPKQIFFCRYLCGNSRDLIDRYTLKRRKYLGTTSMEAEISLFSANQGLVKEGSFVFDPFVGTGSLIITAAHFGARVLGADIDYKILTGTAQKNIRRNFEQYGLQHQLIDLIRMDHSKNNLFKYIPMFDAIITDPPYGIRAGAKKVGRKSNYPKSDEYNQNPEKSYLPPCQPYSVVELLTDLLTFSAKTLVQGGRLVFWLPTTNDFKNSDLPDHPCFKLIANSQQFLTLKYSRRLVTYEKIIEFDEALHSDFKITYDFDNPKDLSYSNLSARVLNDPNRLENPNPEMEELLSNSQKKRQRTRAERRMLKKKFLRMSKDEHKAEQNAMLQTEQNETIEESTL